MHYSPLRYPGGKNRLAKFIALTCERNDICGHYVEPYAGGASVALYLLLNGYMREVTINDLDKAIYAFWHSALNETDKFCRKITRTRVTVRTWRKFKKIYKNKETASLFDLGFATFFLNRTNRSGIIEGGMIGGFEQQGDYKIDCRFNKRDLIKRIRLIAKNKEAIHLQNVDALTLVEQLQANNNEDTIFYFDPPYYLKGPSLYMNHYQHENHLEVSERIKNIVNTQWIVSYDNTPEIKELYVGYRKKEFSFFHTAYEIREGKEILFFSNNLAIPRIGNPTQIPTN